jgi:hypothetical protein
LLDRTNAREHKKRISERGPTRQEYEEDDLVASGIYAWGFLGMIFFFRNCSEGALNVQAGKVSREGNYYQ